MYGCTKSHRPRLGVCSAGTNGCSIKIHTTFKIPPKSICCGYQAKDTAANVEFSALSNDVIENPVAFSFREYRDFKVNGTKNKLYQASLQGVKKVLSVV